MTDTRTDIEVMPTGQLPETPAVAPIEHAEAPRQKTERDLIMERIAAKYEQQRERELEQGRVYDEEARANGLIFQEDTPDEPPAEPEFREEQDTQPARATPERSVPARSGREAVREAPSPVLAPAALQPTLFPIDINGQQIYVTQEQLVHLAKTGAVTNQVIADYRQQQSQPRDPQPVAPPLPVEPEIDETRIREAVRHMQLGSEEEGVTALTKLVRHVVERQPRQDAVDTSAIEQRAVNQAILRMQMQRDAEIINSEYPDILANRQLQQLAQLNVQEVLRENALLGRQVLPLDVYREAGNRVYDALGKSRPGSQTQPQPIANSNPPPAQAAGRIVVAPRDNADARKRAAPRTTGQVIDRRAAVPEPVRQKTYSDIVEDMRKSRYQPSMR